MEETKWVVQINDKLRSSDPSVSDMEQWKKHSIYKIPACITELNKRAYVPQVVSFGPYHYDKEPLKAMEEHKNRALLHFLKRCRKPLELVFHCMAQVAQDLRDSYKPLDPIWTQDTPKFLRLMILDGCFMLEILRTSDSIPGDYAENDPVFSEHGRLYVIPFIKRDMLMLENQIPLMVLDILIGLEGQETQEEEYLNRQILEFLSPSTPLTESMGKCVHVLDVYRKSLVQQGPSHPTHMPKAAIITKRHATQIVRSATELHEAGIWLRKSKTQSLRDVSFDAGVLRLPSMVVDDTTESMFLNLMAFERLHVGAGNEVTSYVFFMNSIIDGDVDVALLQRRGILVNALGSSKAVSKLFNSLSRDITVDRQGMLEVVQMSLSNYCKMPWKKWRANLVHTYFTNPWAIVSLVAAIFLFGLTIVQTLFTIVQFYQQDKSGSPPVAPATSRVPPHPLRAHIHY